MSSGYVHWGLGGWGLYKGRRKFRDHEAYEAVKQIGYVIEWIPKEYRHTEPVRSFITRMLLRLAKREYRAIVLDCFSIPEREELVRQAEEAFRTPSESLK